MLFEVIYREGYCKGEMPFGITNGETVLWGFKHREDAYNFINEYLN